MPVLPARPSAPQATESSGGNEVQTAEISGLKACFQFPQALPVLLCLSAPMIMVSQHMTWNGIIGYSGLL